MTTIAWDGKILAGDTKITGNTFFRAGTKVFKISENTYFGGSGDREDCLSVAEWLKGNIKEEPKLDPSFAGILVEDGIAYRIESNLRKDKLNTYHAVGSGSQGAMVAMYLGCDAIKAIRVMSEIDNYTNGEIDYFICVKGFSPA